MSRFTRDEAIQLKAKARALVDAIEAYKNQDCKFEVYALQDMQN